MKVLLISLLTAFCLLSAFGQHIPKEIGSVPVPPAFTKNLEQYNGRTLYRLPLQANFVDQEKPGPAFSGYYLETLKINEFIAVESFEEQKKLYSEFYIDKLKPESIPYAGPVNTNNTREQDIGNLQLGETSPVFIYATGEIEWYYRQSEDVIRRFLIYHHNFPAGLHISEEVYAKKPGMIPAPLPEELGFPIMTGSVFLPEESEMNYLYSKADQHTTIVGHIVFQSMSTYDETVKYFENVIKAKAEQSYNSRGLYFKKPLSDGLTEYRILSIEDEAPSYRDPLVSEGRVRIVYDYFLPKCNHQIVVNDIEIIKR